MNINYKLLGIRIKQKRAELKMSQEKLAELSNLSIPHMSHVETGTTKVSLPALVGIVNALQTTIDELLCDSVYKSKSIFNNEIARIVKDCDENEIRLIADTIKALKTSYRHIKRFE